MNRLKQYIFQEVGLVVSAVATFFLYLFSQNLFSDFSNMLVVAFLFIVIFSVMLWSSFSVVRHADALAALLGEPFGTLILTVSVISIEVIMVTAVMITGADHPTLGRDMIFSVVMITLNGLMGISLLVGGLRHIEQDFNLKGANTYLAVIIPLAVVSLILPNYTHSTSTASYSVYQSIFFIIITFGLYSVFLLIQTIRHKDFFLHRLNGAEELEHHNGIILNGVVFHVVLLIACMVPIILLSKKMAILLGFAMDKLGAPTALSGLFVAVLVLAPEGMAAIKAALNDKIQRSINISLGSGLATIGLTIPAVLLIGIITGKTVILGLSPLDTTVLVLTLITSIVNLSSGRSNVIQGLIHLILFATYMLLIFD